MAVQETQLVGLDMLSQETLKDKVDLTKVREVRRTIRRRYANRKNMNKIFKAWDEDNQGRITAKNVFNMTNRLGMNINYDEARVLIASVDEKKKGNLGLNEFLDLVYNNDDALDIDIENLPVKTSMNLVVQRDEMDKQDLLGYLQEDAHKSRQIKHENHVKLILKNRLNDLNNGFHLVDTSKAGYINYERFEQVLKDLGINQKLVTEDDYKSLFEKFKENSLNTNYVNLLNELNEFKLDPDHMYKEQRAKSLTARSASTGHVRAHSIFNPPPEPTHVLDAREQSFPVLENVYLKKVRVARHLKRLFPKKEDFLAYAAKAFELEPEKATEKCLSKEDTKNFFDSIFNNIDANFTKRDFDGFFSTFIYNRNGFTDINELGFSLYE